MKKLLIILVSILLIAFQPYNLQAKDSVKPYYLNEFDDLNSKLESASSIEEKDFFWELKTQYISHIYYLKSLSEVELKNQNFSTEQIKAIKSFDGSDTKASAASAYVSASIILSSYYYNSSTDRTHISFSFIGNWVGTPFWKLIDCTLVGAAGSTAQYAQNGYSNTITFSDGYVVTNSSSTYYSFSGVKHQFGITHGSNFMSGFTVRYNCYAQGEVSLSEIGAEYIHTIQSIDISGISISAHLGSSPSITFSIPVSISTKTNVEWYNIRTLNGF